MKVEKKVLTIAEVRSRYIPKDFSPHRRGVWMTGFLDRVFSLFSPPYTAASDETLKIWNRGYSKADELLSDGGFEFRCCVNGGPLVIDERRAARLRYQGEFVRGRRFL